MSDIAHPDHTLSIEMTSRILEAIDRLKPYTRPGFHDPMQAYCHLSIAMAELNEVSADLLELLREAS